MGIPVDNREAEYAWDIGIDIRRNDTINLVEIVDEEEVPVTKYRHQVIISYQRQDEDKKPIDFRHIIHITELFDEMETVQESFDRLGPLIVQWILEDKETLSGYSE